MSALSESRIDDRGRLSLSELVERTGVPASTIHHYRRIGLIPAPERVAANRFCYHEGHVEVLRMVRLLRDRRGLSLDEISALLPEMLAGLAGGPPGALRAELAENALGPVALSEQARRRVVDAGIELLRTQNYADVTVSQIAEMAGVAKGSVYRHFASKEELFTTVVETLVADTASSFAKAVQDLGGPEGLAHDPAKAAVVFALLVAGAMPILLELGARAAKGDQPSQDLARQVLRTLAESAGRPLADDAVPAGLALIQAAFGTVLAWAVGPDWPPDHKGEVDA